MPAWPKSLHLLTHSLRTAAQVRRLRRDQTGKAQASVLARLLAQLARGSHWSALGVRPGMSVAEFQATVPLQRHAHLAPAIERMRMGEADVLWPGRCDLFALTSGTTGPRKLLPVTEDLVRHFHRAGRESLLHYTARVRHAGVLRGRHLLLGGSTTLEPVERTGPGSHPAFAGELTGILGLNLARWFERHCYEPGAEVAALADWDQRVEAIVRRLSRSPRFLFKWVILARILRLSTSSFCSPGPLVPMPPPCLDIITPLPVRRGSI